MRTYDTSTTNVTEEAIKTLLANGDAKEWKNPRTGATRYYINISGLRDIIGLDQTYYNTGNVSGCSYIDKDGETVTVAHRRAYDGWGDKTYIEGDTVYTTWLADRDDHIAELIAHNIMQ